MTEVPRQIIGELKARLSVSEFLRRIPSFGGPEISLIKKGRGYVALCPFHREKTPSFNVIDGKEIYHCFGCGESGDIFKLAQKFELATSFPQAIAYVAAIGGMEALVEPYLGKVRTRSRKLEFALAEEEFDLDTQDRTKLLSVLSFAQGYFEEQLHNNMSQGGELARSYLAERGIHADFARRLRLGYAPNHDLLLLRMQEALEWGGDEIYDLARRVGLYTGENRRVFSGRITFPIATRGRKVLAFNSRRLKEAKQSPKYKNSPQGIMFHKGSVLLGLEHLCEEDIEKHGLVLVEGQTDLFGFLEQNLGNALTLGSTTLTEEHVGIIAALHPSGVYIMTDGDTAGIKGAIRNANRYLGTEGIALPPVYIVPVERGKDPFDIFYREKRPILEDLLAHRQTPEEFLFAQADEDLTIDGSGQASYDFLRRDTGHIVSYGRFKERWGSMERVLERYEATPPHPFLLEKAPQKIKANLVEDTGAYTGEQLHFNW